MLLNSSILTSKSKLEVVLWKVVLYLLKYFIEKQYGLINK